jgi:hypothetical protein
VVCDSSLVPIANERKDKIEIKRNIVKLLFFQLSSRIFFVPEPFQNKEN